MEKMTLKELIAKKTSEASLEYRFEQEAQKRQLHHILKNSNRPRAPTKPSFLEESQKVLENFKSRDTKGNVQALKKELECFTNSKGKNKGFSFSLTLSAVRKKIEEDEKEQLKERIKNGTATQSSRVFSEQEVKLKTLNSFLVKYKEKFQYKGTPSVYLPNPELVLGGG
jgi:hypothetical protein